MNENYNVFREKKENKNLPTYQYIPLLWTFVTKIDGRRKASLYTGGHVSDNLGYDLYSGSMNMETMRIAFAVAELYALDAIAGDIAFTYLQAFTCEKVYTMAEIEYGKEVGEKTLIIVKTLYGLK
eukprot:12046386-Ditylum_brightwellii.AAC.1